MGRNKGISEVVAENGAATTFAQSGILLGHHRHFLWTLLGPKLFSPSQIVSRGWCPMALILMCLQNRRAFHNKLRVGKLEMLETKTPHRRAPEVRSPKVQCLPQRH